MKRPRLGTVHLERRWAKADLAVDSSGPPWVRSSEQGEEAMSTIGERATQARSGIEDLEAMLERSDKLLAVAEKADEVAARRGRTVLKVLLLLTVVGVTIVVIRKVVRPQPNPVSSPAEPRPPEESDS